MCSPAVSKEGDELLVLESDWWCRSVEHRVLNQRLIYERLEWVWGVERKPGRTYCGILPPNGMSKCTVCTQKKRWHDFHCYTGDAGWILDHVAGAVRLRQVPAVREDDRDDRDPQPGHDTDPARLRLEQAGHPEPGLRVRHSGESSVPQWKPMGSDIQPLCPPLSKKNFSWLEFARHFDS